MIDLTTRAVEAAKAPARGRTELHDARSPGLSLIVSSTGVKAWQLRYSAPDGARRKVGLGRFPAVSLAAARTAAEDARAAIRGGAPPVTPRSRKLAQSEKVTACPEAPTTVAELWALYIQKTDDRRAPATRKLYAGLWTNHVGWRLGDMPLSEVKKSLVRLALEEIGKRTPQGANNSKIMLSGMFNWAVKRELLPYNLIAGLEMPHPMPFRDFTMTDAELRRLMRALDQAVVGRRMAVQTACAIKLGLLTGMRASAIAGMRAEEIDRAARVWTVPASRMKGRHHKRRPHVVPLSDLAVIAIEDAFHANGFSREGVWDGPAFPNRADPARSMCRLAMNKAMRRLHEEFLPDAVRRPTFHDLRRVMRTALTEERVGASPEIAERVIGHTVGSFLERVYDRNDYLRERRRALEMWAAVLNEIMNGGPRQSNVVPLAQRR